jgi:hypothetical protein
MTEFGFLTDAIQVSAPGYIFDTECQSALSSNINILSLLGLLSSFKQEVGL